MKEIYPRLDALIDMTYKNEYNGADIVKNYVTIRKDVMSSLITFYTPEYAVIGSDSRIISAGLKIKTDNKKKIIHYENSLIGITGRMDFYWNGEKKEVDEILKEPYSFYPFLKEAHLQCKTNERVDITVLEPRYINYDNKNKKIIVVSIIQITHGKIEISSKESPVKIYSGVQCCDDIIQNLPIEKNNMVDSVRKCVEYDMQKSDAVGGDIVIYEMYANGDINKVQ